MINEIMRKFVKDKNGSILVVGAVVLLLIIAAAGAAVDYSRSYRVKSMLQEATDTAALSAVAATGTEKERTAIGSNMFHAKSGDYCDGDVTFSFSVSQVTATSSCNLDTTFMGIFGIHKLAISAITEVTNPSSSIGAKEVALILDYSNSMNNARITALRAGTQLLVSLLESAGDIRISLVPFSEAIFPEALPSSFINGYSSGSVNCIMARQHPYVVSGAVSAADVSSHWEVPPGGKLGNGRNCSEYSSSHVITRPLSNDLEAIKGYLSDIQTAKGTNIALGLEFAWTTLSPDLIGPFGGAAKYTDKSVTKHVVLFTDGGQSTKGYSKTGGFHVNFARNNSVTLCGAMKKLGIIIHTVAFDVYKMKDRDVMKSCATSPSLFHEGSQVAEIQEIFNEIGNNITEGEGGPMYISK